jgi:hypothetical protein
MGHPGSKNMHSPALQIPALSLFFGKNFINYNEIDPAG